jgi:hypothetical protein
MLYSAVQQIIQVLFEFPNTDGTAGQVLQTDGYANLSFSTISASGKFESALLHVRDEKANNTAGGTATSGSYETRTLNTVMTNEISGASLSSNQITLPAGTYYINAFAPSFKINGNKIKLRNITDSSDTLIGTAEFSQNDFSTGYTKSFVVGRFTIAGQKVFEIQHRCEQTVSNDGFGYKSNFGDVEVYTNVMIWKVA